MRQPNLFQLFQPMGGVGASARAARAAVVAFDAEPCHATAIAHTVRKSPQPCVARMRSSFDDVSAARQAR